MIRSKPSSRRQTNSIRWRKVVVVSNGSIGLAVLQELLDQDAAEQIVFASRKGKNIGLSHTSVAVAKLNMLASDAQKQLTNLAQGADVIFCCVDLKCEGAVEARSLPKVTHALVQAGANTGAAIVFADNMSAFGPEGMQKMPLAASDMVFTKDESCLGSVAHARANRQLLDAHAQEKCKVAIVRAADYFGPGVESGALGLTLRCTVKNKKPYVLGDPDKSHAYTYLPDFAKSLVAVAGDPSAWGRAWHCPTAPELSTRAIVKYVAALNGNETMAQDPSFVVLEGFLLHWASLFDASLRGQKEKSYAWKGDFLVDHSDFAAKFPHLAVPTPWSKSLQATFNWFRK